MQDKTEIYTLTGKKIGVVYNMYPEQYTLTGKKINDTITRYKLNTIHTQYKINYGENSNLKKNSTL